GTDSPPEPEDDSYETMENEEREIMLSRANVEIVSKIKYRLEFEEYPETSKDGVACVYNVAGMDTEKALEIFDLKNIQYAYKDGITRESVYCHFLKTKVYKETRTCRGIKICQFAAPELTTMTHTSREDDTSAPTYFIGCENFKNGERGHRYQSLSGRINIEINSRTIKMPVKFWHYVPEDLENCLYIVIMSRNIYNHPPPPPSKIPMAIQNDLRDIIAEEDILDITARKLITRVLLPELHPSLNNRSKIGHMIATKRRAEHLFDQDIMGVAHILLKQDNDDDPYIRTIHMSFKRVHGPINEWEVCAYIEKYQKTYEVMNTLEFLEHCEEPGIAAQTIWTSTPFKINAGESAHANINRNGRNLSLLAAINKHTNVPESYQNKSSLQRATEAVKKTCKRSNETSAHQKSSKKARVTSESVNIEEQERL
ncbi:3395_t:CDS:10, partial [Gigaspora margarita]